MKLTIAEWKLIGQAVSFVGLSCGDKRAIALSARLGIEGQLVAQTGVEPADPSQPPPAGWTETRPVEDEVNDAYDEATEKRGHMRTILVELGNRLVDEQGFEPARVSIDPERDARLLKSTQPVAQFVAWLDHVREARTILDRFGLHWPRVQKHKSGDGTRNVT